MSICKRGCRKCFPNGCCGFCKPPPQVQQQVDTEIHLKKNDEKKKTPYGFIEISPGVRTSDNSYTSPMLCVHLYRHSQFKAKIVQDKRTVIVDNANQQQTNQGPQEMKAKDKFTAEEEIIMLPVEDVIRIISKSEIEKGIAADIVSHTIPHYEPSENCCDRCYDSLLSCCRKTRDCCCYCCQKKPKVVPLALNRTTLFVDEDPNRFTDYDEESLSVPEEKESSCTRCLNFVCCCCAPCCDRFRCCTPNCKPFRCWCCRTKKLVRLIKRTKTVGEKEAQRVITMTIEYIPYSNLDAASNPHLLDSEQKLTLYKDQFKTDKLEFYLVHSTEFDPVKFELQRDDAKILCRTVMHLKAMKNHYPSENQLKEILGPSYKKTFGDEFNEPVLQLPFKSTTTRKDPQIHVLPQPPQRPAIQQQRTTTSEDHDEAEKKVIQPDIIIDQDDF